MAAPAGAAERAMGLGSFDRLRVSGPFRVEVAAGPSPAARISGPPRVIERVELRVEGRTLIVRMAAGAWGERPEAVVAEPIRVVLSTPALASVAVFGGGEVAVARMAGDQVALSLDGPGAIRVADLRAVQLAATLVGPGTLALAGRTTRARLVASGGGRVVADGLDAGDLVVVADGEGSVAARARYTAQVSHGGPVRVAVSGRPKCRVYGGGTGEVRCGDDQISASSASPRISAGGSASSPVSSPPRSAGASSPSR